MPFEITPVDVAANASRTLSNPALTGAVQDAFNARWGGAEDITTLKSLAPHLPQTPDAVVGTVYDGIDQYERKYGAPNRLADEYGVGTASRDDELAWIDGDGPLLMEAQHATDPVRRSTGLREGADHGTAGLAGVLAQDGMGLAILPRGRQTGNANANRKHPLKDELSFEVEKDPTYDGFLSIHGMKPGKAIDLLDDTELHGVIGLGKEPRAVSIAAAEEIVHKAKDLYGLRVVIGTFTAHLIHRADPQWENNGFAFCDVLNELEYGPNNMPKTTRLAGAGENFTTTLMSREAPPHMPTIQVEISRSLRMLPLDRFRRDRQAERMGVYLGYSLARLAADIVAEHGRMKR